MSNQSIDLNNYEAVIRDLAIPPRPQVVTVLFEEMSKDEPDLKRVTQQIAGDVGLSAGMLKAANSPLFGLAKKVSSVPQAVSVLGLRHVSNIATGLAIRHALKAPAKGLSLERFWDSAEKTALLCHFLANSLRGVPADEAYTYGLFHDCGIPVLAMKFPRYLETLKRANRSAGEPFTRVEEGEMGTSHGILGYFLGKSWLLPDHLCQAILLHHEVGVFADAGVPGPVRNLIGIGHLAEHVHHVSLRSSEDVEWDKFKGAVASHFGLTEEDLINLEDEAQAFLQDVG